MQFKIYSIEVKNDPQKEIQNFKLFEKYFIFSNEYRVQVPKE